MRFLNIKYCKILLSKEAADCKWLSGVIFYMLSLILLSWGYPFFLFYVL